MQGSEEPNNADWVALTFLGRVEVNCLATPDFLVLL